MASKFGTIDIKKAAEEAAKPREIDMFMRVCVIGADGVGKTSLKDRFCFDRWVDTEAELLRKAKAKKKPKKVRKGLIQPLPPPPVVYECGTKQILWSPGTGCHWEEEVKEKDGDVLLEVLMVDSFQKYKTLSHRRGALERAQSVAILYDVGDRDTFDEARELCQLVADVCPEGGHHRYGVLGGPLSKNLGLARKDGEGWGGPETTDNEAFVCAILIGCKCDKEPMSDEAIAKRKAEGKMPLHRVVSFEEGERMAREFGFFFHESSPLIDSDVNRNRTKNTVTQVWTTNSTTNDAIEQTINMCCCKWKGDMPREQHPQYYPKDKLPPLKRGGEGKEEGGGDWAGADAAAAGEAEAEQQWGEQGGAEGGDAQQWGEQGVEGQGEWAAEGGQGAEGQEEWAAGTTEGGEYYGADGAYAEGGEEAAADEVPVEEEAAAVPEPEPEPEPAAEEEEEDDY